METPSKIAGIASILLASVFVLHRVRQHRRLLENASLQCERRVVLRRSHRSGARNPPKSVLSAEKTVLVMPSLPVGVGTGIPAKYDVAANSCNMRVLRRWRAYNRRLPRQRSSRAIAK